MTTKKKKEKAKNGEKKIPKRGNENEVSQSTNKRFPALSIQNNANENQNGILIDRNKNHTIKITEKTQNKEC